MENCADDRHGRYGPRVDAHSDSLPVSRDSPSTFVPAIAAAMRASRTFASTPACRLCFSTLNLLAGIIVVAFGLCLIALAGVMVFKRTLAERFLKQFASSAQAHYFEQTIRLIVGIAIVMFSSSMWYPDLFEFFGWLIIVTAAGLFLVPWQWHHRFGKWAIPLAIRHLRLYAIGVFALGTLVLYGASRNIL